MNRFDIFKKYLENRGYHGLMFSGFNDNVLVIMYSSQPGSYIGMPTNIIFNEKLFFENPQLRHTIYDFTKFSIKLNAHLYDIVLDEVLKHIEMNDFAYEFSARDRTIIIPKNTTIEQMAIENDIYVKNQPSKNEN